jgi:DNA-binding CsgD family transcriptional regulator
MTWLAVLDALRGDEMFDDHLARAEHLAGAHPTGIVACVIQDLLRWARGLHSPDANAALHHYEQIAIGIVRRMAAIDRLEAAVRAGRLDLGREWTAELDEFARATDQRWASALAAHGKAVLAAAAEDPTADELFRSALNHHTAARRPFDRARTHLAYGEYLRRARRRVDSRDQLRTALQMFEDLGARPWADRAATELRASGQTARRRDDATRSELTPQELQVARLVKQGKSNRDAAAQLFISPRTIDFHLRNVFAKIGVSSRAELAQVRLE